MSLLGLLMGIWGRGGLFTGTGGPQSPGHQWKAHLCWVWIWNALLGCMCSQPTVLLGVQGIFRSWVPIWGLSQHPCRGLWYPGLVHTLPWGTQASSTKGSLQNLLGDAWSIMEWNLQPGAKIIFFLLFKFPRVVCYNNKCSFVIFLIESQLDVWGGIDDRWSILSQDLLSMRWFYWHDF